MLYYVKSKENVLLHYLDIKNSPCVFSYADIITKEEAFLEVSSYFVLEFVKMGDAVLPVIKSKLQESGSFEIEIAKYEKLLQNREAFIKKLCEKLDGDAIKKVSSELSRVETAFNLYVQSKGNLNYIKFGLDLSNLDKETKKYVIRENSSKVSFISDNVDKVMDNEESPLFIQIPKSVDLSFGRPFSDYYSELEGIRPFPKAREELSSILYWEANPSQEELKMLYGDEDNNCLPIQPNEQYYFDCLVRTIKEAGYIETTKKDINKYILETGHELSCLNYIFGMYCKALSVNWQFTGVAPLNIPSQYISETNIEDYDGIDVDATDKVEEVIEGNFSPRILEQTRENIEFRFRNSVNKNAQIVNFYSDLYDQSEHLFNTFIHTVKTHVLRNNKCENKIEEMVAILIRLLRFGKRKPNRIKIFDVYMSFFESRLYDTPTKENLIPILNNEGKYIYAESLVGVNTLTPLNKENLKIPNLNIPVGLVYRIDSSLSGEDDESKESEYFLVDFTTLLKNSLNLKIINDSESLPISSLEEVTQRVKDNELSITTFSGVGDNTLPLVLSKIHSYGVILENYDDIVNFDKEKEIRFMRTNNVPKNNIKALKFYDTQYRESLSSANSKFALDKFATDIKLSEVLKCYTSKVEVINFEKKQEINTKKATFILDLDPKDITGLITGLLNSDGDITLYVYSYGDKKFHISDELIGDLNKALKKPLKIKSTYSLGLLARGIYGHETNNQMVTFSSENVIKKFYV